MFILKLILIILTVVLAATPGHTQITITAAGLAPAGTSAISHQTAEMVGVDPGPSGANQTWNVGSFTFDYNFPQQWVEPASTPYGSSFPTATQCVATMIGGPNIEWSYYQHSPSEYRQIGTAENYLYNRATPFNPTKLLAPLPLSYPHAPWTSVHQWEVELMPGFSYTFRDSTIHTMDGWGTIVTQFGSEPVLRVLKHQWLVMSFAGNPIDSSEGYAYVWVNAAGIPVVRMSAAGDDPNFTSAAVSIIETGAASAPGLPPVVEQFRILPNYPNPFNPQTTIPVELSRAQRVALNVYDQTGRLVSAETHDLRPGTSYLTVNGAAWPSGTYYARLAAPDGTQAIRMLLLK